MCKCFGYVLLLLSFLSCQQQTSSADTQSRKTAIAQPNPPKDTLLATIEKNNLIGILQVQIDTDTLSFSSNGDFSWKIFPEGKLLSQIIADSITWSEKNDTTWYDIETNQTVKGTIFRASSSYLLYKGYKLFKGVIVDSIPLVYGLNVGMKKEDFYMKILAYYPARLKKMNVVVNSDPPGEKLDIYFNFNGDTLRKITIKGPY